MTLILLALSVQLDPSPLCPSLTSLSPLAAPPHPLQDTGLYYDRYLREVIEVLETDPHFREKLQTANTEDIKVSVGTLQQWLGSAPRSPPKGVTSPSSPEWPPE